MSCRWSNNHKYGEGMCPECGFIRALNEYGRLQKHTRRTRYKGMKNWLIPCEGSNKDPVELGSNDG